MCILCIAFQFQPGLHIHTTLPTKKKRFVTWLFFKSWTQFSDWIWIIIIYKNNLQFILIWKRNKQKHQKKMWNPFFRKFLRRFRERARGRKNNTHTEQTEIVRTNEITICKPKRKKRIERIGCSLNNVQCVSSQAHYGFRFFRWCFF